MHFPHNMPVSKGRRSGSAGRIQAFTLVELLVVIGIVALLVGVLLSALVLARRTGSSARVAADLQAISAGLEQYKTDHGFYPPVTYRDPAATNAADRPFNAVAFDLGPPRVVSRPTQPNGSIILAMSMFGLAGTTEPAGFAAGTPGTFPFVDGQDGPGFRTRTLSGLGPRVYGPYLQADRFRVKNVLVGATLYPVIVDNNDLPILYCPATRGSAGDLSLPGSLVGADPTANTKPLFQLTPAILADELRPFLRRPGEGNDVNTINRIRRMLGERKVNPDGSSKLTGGTYADLSVLPVGRQSFLLWAAGNDGKFFPDAVNLPPAPTAEEFRKFNEVYEKNDDVTNFRGAGQ